MWYARVGTRDECEGRSSKNAEQNKTDHLSAADMRRQRKKNNTSRQTAKTRVTDMQRPLIDVTCSHSTLSCHGSQSLRSQSSFPSWPSFLSGPMCGLPIHSLQPTGIIPPPRQFTTIHLTQIPFEDVPRSTSTVTP